MSPHAAQPDPAPDDLPFGHGIEDSAPEPALPDLAAPWTPTPEGSSSEPAGVAAAESGKLPAAPCSAPRASAPGLADGVLRPLAPEQVLADRIGGMIFTGFAALAALVSIVLGWIFDWFPHWLDWAALPLGLVALTLLGLFSWRWPLLEQKHTRWRVDAHGMEIHKGVLWRSVISVPRSRVQHTDVSQGPIQRRYGLSSLSLHTAGTEHAEVELQGLRRSQALFVRDFLLSLPREDVDVV